ncbi:hypothetical protein Tco_1212784 [Tanacetum coccineum]
MVAFLTKPQGSEDFHQIVDFLKASHIRYALTENKTIYVSPINQFWCTASARTLGNGEIELIATVDGQEKTITEASVKRHLKLADVDGITTLPTTEIFEQLALMGGEGPTSPVGTQHTPTVIETSPQLQNISITYRTTRTRSRRMGIRIPQSNVLPHVADEAITKEMHDGLGRATTTASSLEAEQGSGNISKTQTKATPSRLSSPRTSSEGGPEGDTSRSKEGSMQLFELMDICKKLSDKVTTLEDELRSIKAVYNKSLITLTKRVKKLENKLKLKIRSTIVDSSKYEEASLDNKDPSKQGRMIEEIDQDENVNLVKSSKQGEAHETAEHRIEKKDKGKAIMQESKELAKSIARQEQEKYDFEKALELQKQLEEREEVVATSTQAHDIDWSDPAVIRYHALQNKSFSVAEVKKNMRFIQKQLTKEEKEKKKDEESSKQVEEEIVQKEDVILEQVMKESSRKAKGRLKRKASKAREDKDNRQKKQDDPEKLTLMEYVEVISDFEEAISVTTLAVKSLIVSWKSYCKGDVGYYEIHRIDGSYKTYIFFSQMRNDFDREDLIVLYRLFNEKYASTRLGFDDLMLWGDIKIKFEPDYDDAVWENHNNEVVHKELGDNLLRAATIAFSLEAEQKSDKLRNRSRIGINKWYQSLVFRNFNLEVMEFESAQSNTTAKQGNNEDTSSKAMLAIDSAGFDWSDMAEERVQTNMALMAFSDSEVYNDKTCSKTCLKNYETLKKQCDDLIVKLNQTEFTATTYKRGLTTVEEQLITYRKNEVLFSEEVSVLKREVACKD